MKINTKKLKYGTAAMVITVVVTVLVILVNVIIALFSDRVNMNLDLTPNKDFAITDETKDYLASLTENVEICTTVDEVVFQNSDSKYIKQAYEVLKKYAAGSGRVSLNFVDMTVNPTYVDKYKQYYSGSISENSIVLFNSDTNRIRVISINDLFNTEVNYYTMSQNIVSSKAEKTLTSAIMYITDPNPKTAVYLDIVTESAVEGNVRSMLEDDGFDVVKIDPLTEEIPEDASLIVVNSPLNDFSEELVDKLYSFMENDGNYGKNMIYLASTAQNATPNIDAFLAEWGVKAVSGIVSDSNQQNILTGSAGYGFVTYIGDSGTISSGDGASVSYTGGIPSETLTNPIALYYARPLELLFDHRGNVSVYSLLNTAETGYALTEEMTREYSETGVMPDIKETEVPLMVLANKYVFKDNEQILSNLLVISSDTMLNNSYTSQTYFNNGDYFISIVNKISGKENGIDIIDKDLSGQNYQATESQISVMRIIFMFVVPGAAAAAGIVVWLRRRHK
ncbi:MAG: GldG family protein [Prevotella sp.]|nr:GldG family protein [Prevotella sp.]